MQDFSKFKGRIVPFRGMDDDGMITLYIRYSHYGTSSRKSTNIRVRPEDWNGASISGAVPESRCYNLRLMAMKSATDDFIATHKTGAVHKVILDALSSVFVRVRDKAKDTSLVSYARSLYRSKLSKGEITDYTYRISMGKIDAFERFQRTSKTGMPHAGLSLEDINATIVRNFIDFKIMEDGISTSASLNKSIQPIVTAIRAANAEGLILDSTFAAIGIALKEALTEYDIKPQEHSVHVLRGEDLRILRSGRLCMRDAEPLADAVDIFIFSLCTCGLSFSDVARLQWNDISSDWTSMKKPQYKTARNPIVVPLSVEAISILARWAGRHAKFIFGILPEGMNVNDSRNLRKVIEPQECYYDAMLARAARLCGLKMSMSMSDARHTFAVSCAKRGMYIKTLSRFLGMSLQKTEKVYGTYYPENDVECLDKCLKSLWNE